MPKPADRCSPLPRPWRRLVLVLSLGAGAALNLHAQAASAADPIAGAEIDPHVWPRLAGSGALADLVARLRAIDCPPAIIRAIVFEQLRAPFAARTREVCAAIETKFFWRTPQAMEPKLEQLRRALSRDLSEAARALLGPGADELSAAERAVYRRQYGDLPPKKIDLMQRLLSDYRDLTKLAQIETLGLALPSDSRATLALLARELRSDLARNFTPAELEGYDLRSSRTANSVRFELAPLPPTEAEFLAVYRLQKDFDDRFSNDARNPTPAQIRERADGRQKLLDQIAAALGPARYAEYQRANNPATRPRLPSRPPAPHRADGAPATAPGNAAASRPGGGPWAALESDDPLRFAARLRAAGFPAETVRAILSARLSERRFTRELHEIYDGDGRTYWIDSPGFTLDTPEKQAAARRIEREETDTLRQLFGADHRVLDAVPLAYQRRNFGPLPAKKIARLLDIFDHLSGQREQLPPPDTSPAVIQQLAELQAAADAEVASLLTPAERERYELRRGPVAEHLRHTVIGFSATLEEFEAVSRIYRPLAEMLSPGGTPQPGQAGALAQAEERLQAQLRTSLGAERFADFQLAKHGNRQLNELVSHLDLPLAAARTLATVEEDSMRRANALHADHDLTPASRNTQLTELAREAANRITDLLGERGFEIYQTYGGQWLVALAPAASR